MNSSCSQGIHLQPGVPVPVFRSGGTTERDNEDTGPDDRNVGMRTRHPYEMYAELRRIQHAISVIRKGRWGRGLYTLSLLKRKERREGREKRRIVHERTIM